MFYPDMNNLVTSTRMAFISALRRFICPDDRMYISGEITALEWIWLDRSLQSGSKIGDAENVSTPPEIINQPNNYMNIKLLSILIIRAFRIFSNLHVFLIEII